MSLPVQALDVYKYLINNVLIYATDTGKRYTVEAKYIGGLDIIESYYTNIAPQLVLSCLVDYDTYYELLSSASSLRATFTLNSAIIGKSTQKIFDSAVETQYTDEWVTCSFKATDSGFLLTRDITYSELSKEMNQESQSRRVEDERKEIRFYLYNDDALIHYRSNKSFVINGSMNDVLTYLLQSRDFDHVLMSASDNSERKEYLVPYGDLGSNLEFINDTYGIYNHKYLFYMGLDRNYLINQGNIGSDTEFGEIGNVNIYLEKYDATKASSTYLGCIKDDIRRQYILVSNSITIDNIDTLQDFSVGGNINIIRSDFTKQTEQIGEYAVDKSYSVNNSLRGEQIINEMKENKRIVYITVSSIDLSIITPNKLYNLIADETAYDTSYAISGKYRLTQAEISLSNDGSGTLSNGVRLALMKVSD